MQSLLNQDSAPLSGQERTEQLQAMAAICLDTDSAKIIAKDLSSVRERVRHTLFARTF